MKKLLVIAAAAGVCFASANANELEERCLAYMTETGGDASGCSCIGETADDAVSAELLALAEAGGDESSLSSAAVAALDACWPDRAS
ncbi:MAG: hypothetical protein AAGA09_07095 [Pseudomonadota bacterium]